MRLEQDDLQLRELLFEDKDIMLKWMTDPRVLEFYEGRDTSFSLEEVERKFFTASEGIQRCLLIANGLPVGYLQFYPVSTEEEFREYGFADPGGPVFAMDLFLGVPDRWGKGLGRRFISMLLSYLTAHKKAQAVLLDPRTVNERAIRCYEACGFQKEKLLSAHELHEGSFQDCWLMCWRPDQLRLEE